MPIHFCHEMVAEEKEPWRPLDDGAQVAVPRTEPGSVALPSKQASSGGVSSGEGVETTMAFSIETSASGAAAAIRERMNASSKVSFRAQNSRLLGEAGSRIDAAVCKAEGPM